MNTARNALYVSEATKEAAKVVLLPWLRAATSATTSNDQPIALDSEPAESELDTPTNAIMTRVVRDPAPLPELPQLAP